MRILIRSTLLAVLFGTGFALAIAAHAQGLSRHNGASVSAHTPVSRVSPGGKAPAGHKKKRHTPAAVTLTVAAGYNELYRFSAWVPVRVTAQNRTADTITGTLEVPDASTSGGQQGPPQPYRALYQTPVILPGGVTKQITLYMPALSVNGSINVQLRDANHIYATASDSPSAFDQNSLSIGALTNDPANLSWLKRLDPGSGSNVSLVRLTPATVDPLPDALANFDLVVITDGSVSRLDRDQLSALEQYVRNGGTIVLIGGPGWQETLRPLPQSLIPGSLGGTQTLADLRGLLSIRNVSLPRHQAATSVSVLHNPQGTVLAAERGVPLAVQDPLGSGQILYLAFDPTLDPIAHWASSISILDRLILRAAPAAAGRETLPQGAPPQAFFNKFGGPGNIAGELSNVPSAALPSILLFLVLTVLYILVLGPANFLILRRLRRQELMWVTVPLGALLCLGSTFGVAYHLKGSTVLINTIGMVTLDGTNGPHPAALYMGLFAPVRGDYKLTFDGPSLPQYVPQYYYNGGPGSPNSTPLGLRFQEGAQTGIQFLGMNMWSMRDAALHTTVNVPGRVLSKLHIDSNGYIVGAVHNDTRLTLVHPSIIAGHSMIHLPDMPPEKTIPVRVKPHLDIFDHNYAPIWYQLYGQPQFGGQYIVSRGLCIGCNGPGAGGGGFFNGPCCYGPSAPTENSFNDRIRNTVTQLPDAQNVSSLGEVLFVAWNQQPLGSITVDGVSPQRRDLNLVVSPLLVNFGPGPFTLRTGTFGARLVDISPQSSSNGCCGPSGPDSINIGAGGSVTFQFDLRAGGQPHFKHLLLHADAGGADGTNMGRVWDWRAGRWVTVDLALGSTSLHDPARFISPSGALLVKLVNTGSCQAFSGSCSLRISDIHRNVQISGDGIAA